jgi:hypothetical protein
LIPETKGVPLEKMDELFEIKLAFRAHGIMVQRMEEVDHHGSRYAGEKSEVEERVGSV